MAGCWIDVARADVGSEQDEQPERLDERRGDVRVPRIEEPRMKPGSNTDHHWETPQACSVEELPRSSPIDLLILVISVSRFRKRLG